MRGTKYGLPLFLDHLYFANTAILAGIGHGKSHISAIVVTQLNRMRKKILVIDPTGAWIEAMKEIKQKLDEMKVNVAISQVVENVQYRVEGDKVTMIPVWKD